jgi:hypothetical protein
MEARYERRKQELLDECKVAPQIFEGVLPRLETFMEPFVESLVRKEQVAHAQTFVQGLLSDLDAKNLSQNLRNCATGCVRKRNATGLDSCRLSFPTARGCGGSG